MSGTVLVVGASGLVGAACVEAFGRAGWGVLAISRRTPETVEAVEFEHLRLGLTDPVAVEAASHRLAQVTDVVYTAVFEKPRLVQGWCDTDQMRTNLAMLRALTDALEDAPHST